MKINIVSRLITTKITTTFVFASMLLVGGLTFAPSSVLPTTGKAAAACLTTAPPTTYGQVTQTVNIATAGSYRVWSRIKAPSTAANSYYFQADGGCAYNVGDSTAIPVNAWTWVNYQDGSTSTAIDLTFTAGSHTLTYTGKEADVQLDKVMLLSDKACVPTGTGDNCAVNDTTAPTVGITSPATGSTVSGTVTISANATDASGISKVEFLVDGAIKGSDTSSTYSYAWDTKTATNGSHTIQAKAYDVSGNTTSSSTITVTVNNATSTGDTNAPTVTITSPVSGAGATTGTVLNIGATASDNVAVTKVEFYANGTLIATDTVGPYTASYTAATAGTLSLTAKAYDAAGNSKVSTAVSMTVTGTTKVQGDVNGDNRVNAIDLSALISHDGQNYPAADFNNDGSVGAADMAILLAKWTW